MAEHRRKQLVIGVHTLEMLIETVKQQADWTGVLLDGPDAEWPLMVFVGSLRGEITVYVGPCDPPSSVTKEGEGFWSATLPRALQQQGVAEPGQVPLAAVLASTWCASRSGLGDASRQDEALHSRMVRPRQAPLLFEGLSMHAADASGCRAFQAPIMRRAEGPPVVGEWEELEACDERVMQLLTRMVGAEAGNEVGARR